MPGPTVLLAPTDPTSPLLADGPCGARVPATTVHRHKDGGECANPRCGRAWFINTEQRALVLALDGVPVESACIAVARAVEGVLCTTEDMPSGTTWFAHAGYWLEAESDGMDGEDIVAICIANDGVYYRLPVDEGARKACGDDDVRHLAHIAAARLNCRVIVLDGGEVRDA